MRFPYHSLSIRMQPYLVEYLTSKLDELFSQQPHKTCIIAFIRPFVRVNEYNPTEEILHHGPDYLTFIFRWAEFVEIPPGHVPYISANDQKTIEKLFRMHFKEILANYYFDKYKFMMELHGRSKAHSIIMQFCSDHHITFNARTCDTLRKIAVRHIKNHPLQGWKI